MARNDPDLHWCQIDRTSYPIVQTLIDKLQPYAGLLHGPTNRSTWRLSADSVQILSDNEVNLNGHTLHASIMRLPTHAYRAVVAGSANFTQYHGIDGLYCALQPSANHSGIDAGKFAAELETVAHSERVIDPVPRLVSCPTTYSARWLPRTTFVRLSKSGEYFLGLTFSSRYQPGLRRTQRIEIGLDLGLNPLTVAYTAEGKVATFKLTALSVLDSLPELSKPAGELLEHLVYATGRADAERIIAYVNYHAHTVYAENLNHRGMSDHFVHRGRAHAVHDHHHSYLSQYLNTSRIEFRRVDPAYTSQICAYCLESTGRKILGDRQGVVFTCSQCRA